MTSRSTCLAAAAAAVALVLPLSACSSGEDSGNPDSQSSLQVTTPSEAPEDEFNVSLGNAVTSEELTGEPVDDPDMDISYRWQGTNVAPNGGSVVVVAVKNKSDVPMPVDALDGVALRYTTNGNNKTTADELSSDESGVDMIGLDEPLAPGATVNVKYAFDVPTGNLWDAEFTIGNITFSGNLSI